MSSQFNRPQVVTLYYRKALYGRDPELDGDDQKAEKTKDSLWGQREEANTQAREMDLALQELTTCSNCCAELPIDEIDPLAEYYRTERERHLRVVERCDIEIAVLERITDPDFMGEAFQILEKQFSNNESWYAFLGSARLARRDYSEHRRIAKEANQLSNEIANSARQLAHLISSLRNTGLLLPDILMEPFKEGELYSFYSDSLEKTRLKFHSFLIAARQQKASSAPKEPDILAQLFRIAEACDCLFPDFMDSSIHAAKSTRQHSNKSAFIRAFAELLGRSQIKISSEIKRAMAITGNAVFDYAELTITEDDVRKALLPQNPALQKEAAPKKRD